VTDYSNNISLELSFGIYKMSDKETPVSEAVSQAELAKRTVTGFKAGSNYAFFTPKLEVRLIEDKQMGKEMEYALEHNQFVMFMQPIVDLRSHKIIAAEALVRWDHPVKGILSPFKFIPLFETNNFIIKLDHYIWHEAFKTIRHWIDNKIEPIPISINISPIHFDHPRFMETLCTYAEQFRVPKEYIQLELPERVFSEVSDNILNITNELQKKGFVVCIDNFGSLHSPINALKDSNATIIKMDRKFLNDNINSNEGLTLIRYIHAMAKELGMQVIAEGVETIEQANYLSGLGCDYAQGFFFAKPMALREFDEFNKRIMKNEYIPSLMYPTFEELNKDLLP
ncbi:MAG: EAL domain-containing protein, partial [Butyrivibrio sp.]